MMDERLAPDEVSYAHVAVLNTGDGQIVAGVRLAKRDPSVEGTVWYEPYAVLSLHYDERDVKTITMRQVLPSIVKDIMRNVDSRTRLLIIRGNAPHFKKDRQIEQHISLFATSRGLDVRLAWKQGIEHSIPELKDLANDALRRAESLVSSI
ncbi:hypothetical protein [Paenibacillus taichungensis]|uniref:hypothetical protein n=1 Tax=Paenibacillus taichungensis TaxID=484184 RepID=UPI002870E508|nr:hypothetical protein [Paenibacillus taichungensis]MDR9748815.1 hypothetical protein [Paenibacillus taichungensis]